MRVFMCALLVVAVYSVVTTVNALHRVEQEPMMYRYITKNYQEDTAATNAVAAVLLNYRVYDTIFEALILLTAIVGMHQFLPGVSDGDKTSGEHP